MSIPKELEKELLIQYGEPDEDGYVHTEQDIYEQLRKRLRPYENETVFSELIKI